MKLFLQLATLMALGLSASLTVAQNSASTTSTAKSSASAMSMADKKFVKNAAEGGMAEVELGELATQKASSEDVNKFGQRMVDDHSKANDQLKQIASNKGIDLPSQLSAKDKATKERLGKLSGSDFDRAYMADMVKDHETDVADFHKEGTSGKDTEIKKFAEQTLPTLQDHLQEAKKVDSSVKGTMSSANHMK